MPCSKEQQLDGRSQSGEALGAVVGGDSALLLQESRQLVLVDTAVLVDIEKRQSLLAETRRVRSSATDIDDAAVQGLSGAPVLSEEASVAGHVVAESIQLEHIPECVRPGPQLPAEAGGEQSM